MSSFNYNPKGYGNVSDESDSRQWYYSPIHKAYKHIYTGKILKTDSWDLKFKAKQNISCNHEWVEVYLAMSTVYDCKHCGLKKEDYEKQRLP